MNIKSQPQICLIPSLQGVGGMVSFQGRLTEGLRERGFEITNDLGS